MTVNKHKIKQIFTGLVWLLAGTGCIVLLVSGVRSKNAQRCRAVQIEISGVSDNFFIDKNDVYNIIKNFGGDSTGKRTLAAVDLRLIEKELEKDVWVRKAELFFDNNNILKVKVEEREPVARIFTAGGNTFYTDSSSMRLPLSEKFSARLPVFTNFPSDAVVLSSADSNLLSSIKNISLKIRADSFLMAMIDQVEIMPNRSFELTPKIGNQVIIFGDANDADEKFSKLKLFYKNVIANAGWNRYQSINLQYKNQVVAVVRGRADVVADSLRTLALIKSIAENAAGRSADSTQNFSADMERLKTDSTMLQQQTVQRDEGIEPDANVKLPAETPVTPLQKPVTPPVQKPLPKPVKVTVKQKPKKAPSQKTNNDY